MIRTQNALLALLLGLVLIAPLGAQVIPEWAPIGAKWVYRARIVDQDGKDYLEYSTYEVIRDSVALLDTFKIIKHQFIVSSYRSERILVFQYKNDTVFFLNGQSAYFFI